MILKFRCPQGHKLRFDSKDVGKKGTCPKCLARFVLPNIRREVSDTSIVAVLGEHQPDKTAVIGPPENYPKRGQTKICPKCAGRISAAFHICPNCRVYLPLDSKQPARSEHDATDERSGGHPL
jgi:hypothetical protein